MSNTSQGPTNKKPGANIEHIYSTAFSDVESNVGGSRSLTALGARIAAERLQAAQRVRLEGSDENPDIQEPPQQIDESKSSDTSNEDIDYLAASESGQYRVSPSAEKMNFEVFGKNLRIAIGCRKYFASCEFFGMSPQDVDSTLAWNLQEFASIFTFVESPILKRMFMFEAMERKNGNFWLPPQCPDLCGRRANIVTQNNTQKFHIDCLKSATEGNISLFFFAAGAPKEVDKKERQGKKNPVRRLPDGNYIDCQYNMIFVSKEQAKKIRDAFENGNWQDVTLNDYEEIARLNGVHIGKINKEFCQREAWRVLMKWAIRCKTLAGCKTCFLKNPAVRPGNRALLQCCNHDSNCLQCCELNGNRCIECQQPLDGFAWEIRQF